MLNNLGAVDKYGSIGCRTVVIMFIISLVLEEIKKVRLKSRARKKSKNEPLNFACSVKKFS